MPSRFNEQEPAGEEIDVTKRYDIYVIEAGWNSPGRTVLYRGARFRELRSLVSRRRFDIGSDFYEIEQANGEAVFIRRFNVVKFCEAGATLNEETVVLPP